MRAIYCFRTLWAFWKKSSGQESAVCNYAKQLNDLRSQLDHMMLSLQESDNTPMTQTKSNNAGDDITLSTNDKFQNTVECIRKKVTAALEHFANDVSCKHFD